MKKQNKITLFLEYIMYLIATKLVLAINQELIISRYTHFNISHKELSWNLLYLLKQVTSVNISSVNVFP